jgi:hypothetical protein
MGAKMSLSGRSAHAARRSPASEDRAPSPVRPAIRVVEHPAEREGDAGRWADLAADGTPALARERQIAYERDSGRQVLCSAQLDEARQDGARERLGGVRRKVALDLDQGAVGGECDSRVTSPKGEGAKKGFKTGTQNLLRTGWPEPPLIRSALEQLLWPQCCGSLKARAFKPDPTHRGSDFFRQLLKQNRSAWSCDT